MTEQDRGAYAPQNDAPLAFDPRRDGGRRGAGPLTLIAGALVLIALVVGVGLFYRHGARRHGQPPQIVGAPIGDTKSAPPSSAQTPQDATAGLQVYKTEVPPPGETQPAPAFAAPPEQPQPRPVTLPPPPPVSVAALRAAEPAPAAPPAPPLVAKVSPPKAAPAKVVPPPAATVAPAKAAPPAKAPPAPKAVVVAAAPTPVVAASAGGAMAQIGSETSSALADQAWSDLARKHAGLMTGKSRKIETFDKNGTTYYRALVGGFASHADAVSFCTALKAAGGGCIVR